jgi:hypothetical protein
MALDSSHLENFNNFVKIAGPMAFADAELIVGRREYEIHRYLYTNPHPEEATCDDISALGSYIATLAAFASVENFSVSIWGEGGAELCAKTRGAAVHHDEFIRGDESWYNVFICPSDELMKKVVRPKMSLVGRRVWIVDSDGKPTRMYK